jgi:hypothetical protein
MSDKRVQFDETVIIQEFNENEPPINVRKIHNSNRRSSYTKYINFLFMTLCIMIILVILLC